MSVIKLTFLSVVADYRSGMEKPHVDEYVVYVAPTHCAENNFQL